MSRRAVVTGLLALSLVLIVGGVLLISLPAGMVVAGLALLGLLTFDPEHARKLTWPR